MPYFSRDAELFHEGMRHRERLCELSAVNAAVDDFVNKIIRVVMKALYIGAGQKQDRVFGTSQIEAGCAPTVHLAEVA